MISPYLYSEHFQSWLINEEMNSKSSGTATGNARLTAREAAEMRRRSAMKRSMDSSSSLEYSAGRSLLPTPSSLADEASTMMTESKPMIANVLSLCDAIPQIQFLFNGLKAETATNCVALDPTIRFREGRQAIFSFNGGGNGFGPREWTLIQGAQFTCNFYDSEPRTMQNKILFVDGWRGNVTWYILVCLSPSI